MKLLISVIISLLLFSCKGQEQLKIGDSVEDLIRKTRANGKIPALAVAVLTADSVLVMQTDGVTKDGGTDPVTSKSLFHLGSNTKAITAFIATKLVEEKKLSWQTKFLDLFPELKDSIRVDYQDITLENLLSHRARIKAYTSGLEFMSLPNWKGTTAERRLAFVKTVLNKKPVSDTTKAFHYSNAGYAIAAQMFERASGKTWEVLLAETMQSLGLTYVLGFPNRTDDKQPWGHMDGLLGRKPTDPTHDYKLEDFAAPAGDVAMNIENYSRWIQVQLAGLKGKAGLISAESTKKMHLELPEYAFGWGNSKIKGLQWSWHDGSAGTFYCHASISHADGKAFVILANSADKKSVEAIYALKKMLTAM